MSHIELRLFTALNTNNMLVFLTHTCRGFVVSQRCLVGVCYRHQNAHACMCAGSTCLQWLPPVVCVDQSLVNFKLNGKWLLWLYVCYTSHQTGDLTISYKEGIKSTWQACRIWHLKKNNKKIMKGRHQIRSHMHWCRLIIDWLRSLYTNSRGNAL